MGVFLASWSLGSITLQGRGPRVDRWGCLWWGGAYSSQHKTTSSTANVHAIPSLISPSVRYLDARCSCTILMTTGPGQWGHQPSPSLHGGVRGRQQEVGAAEVVVEVGAAEVVVEVGAAEVVVEVGAV